MESALETARREVEAKVSAACQAAGFTGLGTNVSQTVEEAREGFGDFACTIAFDIAKSARKNPKQVADIILLKMAFESGGLVEKCEASGPYLNFYLSEKFAQKALEEILQKDREFGKAQAEGRKVWVEWPSVNPNKPWHAGHLRNAILGDCAARILEFAGNDVKRLDFINDLGLQVAQSVWGYLKINRNILGKADHWLGAEYVEVAKKMEAEPHVEKQVREIMRNLEEGGNETALEARKLAEECVKAQNQTAFGLGIFHDAMVWESDIVRSQLFKKGLEKLEQSGAAVKEDAGTHAGCVVAKLEKLQEFAGMESPDKVLVRADGTATYTLKDVCFQLWKFGLVDERLAFKKFLEQPNGKALWSTAGQGEEKDFGKADAVVNVIGVEQVYPQKVIASVLTLMGFGEQAANYVHLAYEHAVLPEERFSGRKGTWVGFTADEIIEEAVKRAKAEVRARFKDMSEEEKEKIAQAVGKGAVRFGFVRLTPEKKLVFSWEDALNFEGATAPYVQYMHARSSRIIEKAGDTLKTLDAGKLALPEEKKLVRLLAKFPSEVKRSAKDYRPHYVCDYLLEVADAFSKFYNAAPVLKAEPDEKAARLALVKAAKIVLKNGLWLLGIEAPERM